MVKGVAKKGKQKREYCGSKAWKKPLFICLSGGQPLGHNIMIFQLHSNMKSKVMMVHKGLGNNETWMEASTHFLGIFLLVWPIMMMRKPLMMVLLPYFAKVSKDGKLSFINGLTWWESKINIVHGNFFVSNSIHTKLEINGQTW